MIHSWNPNKLQVRFQINDDHYCNITDVFNTKKNSKCYLIFLLHYSYRDKSHIVLHLLEFLKCGTCIVHLINQEEARSPWSTSHTLFFYPICYLQIQWQITKYVNYKRIVYGNALHKCNDLFFLRTETKEGSDMYFSSFKTDSSSVKRSILYATVLHSHMVRVQ